MYIGSYKEERKTLHNYFEIGIYIIKCCVLSVSRYLVVFSFVRSFVRSIYFQIYLSIYFSLSDFTPTDSVDRRQVFMCILFCLCLDCC